MTPKEYLSQVGRLDTMINQRLMQRDELLRFDGVGAVDYTKGAAHTAKGDAAFTRRHEKLVALEAKINRLLDGYVDLKNTIIGQVQSMANGQHSQLLYKRYIEGKRLEEIAVEMNYSYYRIKHLHGYALQSFGEQFAEILKVDTQ